VGFCVVKNKIMEKILQAYGWEKIISKNPYMDSYIKGKMRLNYYSNGTTTIQSVSDGMIVNKRNILNEEQMEIIIEKLC